MLEFILARYNYWIVIILMMTGLYIVFSRGNLVKTIIGLNVFQTSVFIFYITIGKVVGGTAPILVGGGEPAHGDEGHHGEAAAHGASHSSAHHDEAGHGEMNPVEESTHSPLTHEEAAHYVEGESANALAEHPTGTEVETIEGLHSLPESETPSNSLFDTTLPSGNTAPRQGVDDLAHPEVTIAHGEGEHHVSHPEGEGTLDALTGAVDGVIYSNPLPHVLILTAIVVGVATTAVGLALAVRIREAYGTIEEDALEQMNNEAEFGNGRASQKAAS